jgi:SAM-dependent methyltransferase
MTKKNISEICKSYDKIAEWFDKSRSKNLIEKEYLDLIVRGIPKGSSVLDLGCGAGDPIAKFFIEKGYSLTGIDGSKKMIELSQKRFPGQNFFIADMRDLKLDQKFDAIIAWDSFFHLNKDEQRSMFSVFKSHIKPRGFLVFTSGGPEEGEIWSDNNGENLYHASLSKEEYKKLLADYGFEVVLYRENDLECQEHTVWIARAKVF